MGNLFTETASAATPVSLGAMGIRTQADLDQYISVYYDEMVDNLRGTIDNMQLKALFQEASQKNDEHIVHTKVRGNAAAQINEDGEAIPFITWGQGWKHSFKVFPFRVGVRHTRHLAEIENFGTIAQESEELMDAGKRTILYAMVDVFNRGVDPSSAPFLCIDGMYLCDADRPNPVPNVPNWSNLEAQGAINEDLLFQAKLNAQNMRAANGDRLRQQIGKVYIPSAYEKVAWKLNATPGILGKADNDYNWAKGRYSFETVDDFESNIILYQVGSPASRKYGLQIRWAVKPGVEDMSPEDPDVYAKRLRFRMGLGCLDPRDSIRGGKLDSL
jgi:hypothetical protein